jgi:lysyl-tRNA synthetase class II
MTTLRALTSAANTVDKGDYAYVWGKVGSTQDGNGSLTAQDVEYAATSARCLSQHPRSQAGAPKTREPRSRAERRMRRQAH